MYVHMTLGDQVSWSAYVYVWADYTYALFWETQEHSRWGKASKTLRINTWIKPTEQVQLYTYALIGRHNEAMRQSFPCGPKIMCINQAMIQERSRYVRTYDIRRPSELVSLRKTLRKTQVHSRWGKASMMLRTNTWTKPSEQVQQYTYTLYWRHKTTQNWEIRKKFFVWPKNNVH